tara:strand:- start:240 stop:344 length:105 start_codon:yes stop_codon:yes gene_type:complete
VNITPYNNMTLLPEEKEARSAIPEKVQNDRSIDK